MVLHESILWCNEQGAESIEMLLAANAVAHLFAHVANALQLRPMQRRVLHALQAELEELALQTVVGDTASGVAPPQPALQSLDAPPVEPPSLPEQPALAPPISLIDGDVEPAEGVSSDGMTLGADGRIHMPIPIRVHMAIPTEVKPHSHPRPALKPSLSLQA